MTKLRAVIILATLLGALSPQLARAQQKKAEAAKVTYEDVAKIFGQRCAQCHNSARPRGDLDLSSFEAVLQGGISGKVVVAGKSGDSLLFTAVAHLEEPKMPPNRKIAQSEIDTIKKWIDDGLIERLGKKGATALTNPAAPPRKLDGLGVAEAFTRPTPITALAVSPVVPMAAVAGKKQVVIYDFSIAKVLGGLSFPEGEVFSLRFSPDGKLLMAAGGVGGQSGAVVGFEVGTWKRLFTISDPSEAVLAADLSRDKTMVAFGGPGKTVKVASIPDGKIIHTLRKPTDFVLSVAFSPEGLLVAAGDRFGGLYVWETRSGKEFYTLRGHTKGVTGIAWAADSNSFVTCSEDTTVRRWDMHAGTEVFQWEASEEGLLDIACHPSGTIVTAGRDGQVKIWDRMGILKSKFGPVDDAVLKVAMTNDAKTIFSSDWSGSVRSWPLAGGTPVKFALPLVAKAAPLTVVPVPTPALPVVAIRNPVPAGAATGPVNGQDLPRMEAALKSVEEAAEKMKEEAARNPKNEALTKAYLQLCEAALAMKAEVIKAKASSEIAKTQEKQ